MPLRFLFLLSLAFATRAIAVDVSILDFQRKPSAMKKVSKDEADYFTGRVRKVAAQMDRSWRVMSRENIQKILEENGKDYKACLSSAEGKCEVSIGELLQADYHVVGDLSVVGGKIVLSARVYDVKTSTLKGSEDASAPTVSALMDKVDGLARSLFRQVTSGTPSGGGDGAVSLTSNLKTREHVSVDSSTAVVGVVSQEEAKDGKRLVAKFVSIPAGASIAVDGKAACIAPCSKVLTEGKHVVVGTLEKHEAQSQSVDLTQNGQAVEFRMIGLRVH